MDVYIYYNNFRLIKTRKINKPHLYIQGKYKYGKLKL